MGSTQHQRRRAPEGAGWPRQTRLIRQAGKWWLVAAAGYDALGVPRPGVSKKRIGKFEAKRDQIIANTEGVPLAPNDTELEAAIAAAEATWAKPRTRASSKQAEVVRMLQRPEGARPSARFAMPPAGRPTRCAARSPGHSRRSWG